MKTVVGVCVRPVVLMVMAAGLAMAPTAALPAPGGAGDTRIEGAGRDDSAVVHPGIDPLAVVDATISGLVYDGAGELIDNITVEAVPAADPTADPVASDQTYEYGDLASHGAYRLHVPAGDYKIRFSSPALPERRAYETIYYGVGAGGEAVSVGQGEDLELGDVTMTRDFGVPVSGVVHADGAPRSGVWVGLYRFDSEGEVWAVGTAVTDASGGYTFPHVKRNRIYSVRARGEWGPGNAQLPYADLWLGDQVAQRDAERIHLPSGSAGDTVPMISLRRGTTVTGVILGHEDKPRPDVEVRVLVRNAAGGFDNAGSARSHWEDGTFTVRGVNPGATYTVRADGSWSGYGITFLGDVIDADQAQTVDVPLLGAAETEVGAIRLGSTTTLLTGTVEDDTGEPIADADVGFHQWQDKNGDGHITDNEWTYLRSGGTDLEGAYFLYVPWGETYTAEAHAHGFEQRWLGDVTTRPAAEVVAVPDGNRAMTMEPITMPRQAPRVRGAVVGSDGEAIPGARVILWQSTGPGDRWLAWSSTSTRANGRYSILDLPAGAERITVSVEVPEHAMGRTFLGGTTRPEDATAVQVTGDTQVADIVLTVTPNSILGTLSTSDGQALDGEVRLELYEWASDEGRFDEVRSTSPRSDAFSFTGLAPGHYTVEAIHHSPRGDGYLRSWLGGTRPKAPGDPGVIEVTGDGAVHLADLQLERGVLLSGSLRLPDGSPVSGSVEAHAWKGGRRMDIFRSGLSDGRYEIRVPPSSEVWLLVRTRVGTWELGGESWPDVQTPDNTLVVGTTDQVLDIEVSPAWGAVGKVAGQRLDYCLHSDLDPDYWQSLEFDGRKWRVYGDGALEAVGQDSYPMGGELETSTRAPLLLPFAADSFVRHYGKYGVSPDGNTLCLVMLSGGGAPVPTFQLLMTKAEGGGYDVTYNFDTVPDGWTSRSGSNDGDGNVLVLDGAGVVDGYADSNTTTGLIHHSLGSTQPGRYRFHFDGFYERAAAPRRITRPTIEGPRRVGESLTATPGTWELDGAATADLEFGYTWMRGRSRSPVGVGPTYQVQKKDDGRKLRVLVTAWTKGHLSGGASSVKMRVASGPASGAVTDQYGLPIEHATVTLLHSDSASGPFEEVADGSDIMSTDNRANPSSTGEGGLFAWDVIEGFYRVRAESTGCVTRTTDPMEVLPDRDDLLIKLSCDAAEPSAAPTVTGSGMIGKPLATNADVWPSPMVATVQWLRDGEPINGATGPAYTPQADDLGTTITVEHTAQAPTYVQEKGRGTPVTFSAVTRASADGVGITLGEAPSVSSPPAVSGVPRVGGLLTASPGGWPSGSAYAYQWLRGGTPIVGATSATYRPTLADVGSAVAVRVTASRAGYAPGSASSAVVMVPKVSSTTAVTAKKKVKRGRRGKLVVTVTAPGNPAPTGPVTVRRGTKTFGTATLTASSGGKVVVRTPKLRKKGKYKLVVTYGGDGVSLGSRAKPVTLRVR